VKTFAKSENDSAPCDYGSATLLSDNVILCNFNMLMKRVSLGLKRKALFSSENKQKFVRFSQNFVLQKFLLLRKFSQNVCFCRNVRFHKSFLENFCTKMVFAKSFSFLEKFYKKFSFLQKFSFSLMFLQSFCSRSLLPKTNFFN
jgi:hypothetical protein